VVCTKSSKHFVYQLISKRIKYYFNSESLTFAKVRNSWGNRIRRSLQFLVFIHLFALSLIFIINLFTNFSEIKVQQLRINRQNEKYLAIAGIIDQDLISHQKNLIAHDINYRNILEMDSIPENIRYAGTGGYIPSEPFSKNFNTRIYSDLQQKIGNLMKRLEIQNESYDEIYKKAVARNIKLERFPGISPVKLDSCIFISSSFGTRDDPFTLFITPHQGLDMAGRFNTAVYSTASGTVTLCKHSRIGYGNEIIIDHGYGYSTRYAHLNKILVSEGQKVKRGQKIGLMGNSGRSTGIHLHYEVRLNGTPKNPMYFFADNLTPEEYENLTKKTD
jgi:murein DD-endopeptidase MepM/ murein hydrolase activator NlpD